MLHLRSVRTSRENWVLFWMDKSMLNLKLQCNYNTDRIALSWNRIQSKLIQLAQHIKPSSHLGLQEKNFLCAKMFWKSWTPLQCELFVHIAEKRIGQWTGWCRGISLSDSKWALFMCDGFVVFMCKSGRKLNHDSFGIWELENCWVDGKLISKYLRARCWFGTA
jgi:hypothetical protein